MSRGGDEGWACGGCTLQNRPRAKTCLVCGAARPGGAETPKPPPPPSPKRKKAKAAPSPAAATVAAPPAPPAAAPPAAAAPPIKAAPPKRKKAKASAVPPAVDPTAPPAAPPAAVPPAAPAATALPPSTAAPAPAATPRAVTRLPASSARTSSSRTRRAVASTPSSATPRAAATPSAAAARAVAATPVATPSMASAVPAWTCESCTFENKHVEGKPHQRKCRLCHKPRPRATPARAAATPRGPPARSTRSSGRNGGREGGEAAVLSPPQAAPGFGGLERGGSAAAPPRVVSDVCVVRRDGGTALLFIATEDLVRVVELEAATAAATELLRHRVAGVVRLAAAAAGGGFVVAAVCRTVAPPAEVLSLWAFSPACAPALHCVAKQLDARDALEVRVVAGDADADGAPAHVDVLWAAADAGCTPRCRRVAAGGPFAVVELSGALLARGDRVTDVAPGARERRHWTVAVVVAAGGAGAAVVWRDATALFTISLGGPGGRLVSLAAPTAATAFDTALGDARWSPPLAVVASARTPALVALCCSETDCHCAHAEPAADDDAAATDDGPARACGHYLVDARAGGLVVHDFLRRTSTALAAPAAPTAPVFSACEMGPDALLVVDADGETLRCRLYDANADGPQQPPRAIDVRRTDPDDAPGLSDQRKWHL
ncbi:hypothetical protein M885DRAFT_273271 [Pelagophyceae sp. CCMP2097]|nr:hypothetical protein M885DRAFT_273271 [Pelagophyceae sp. CCMP2097]